MRRRDFLTLLGGATAARPLTARTQQPAVPVIGLLSGFAANSPLVANFHRGLKESGFSEGQNVALDYRSADGRYDRLPELAADLIKKRVSVIATLGERAALAVKATRMAFASKIPFVFSLGEDPMALGLVTSLNRPEDNITGVTSITQSLELKRLELLREFVPNATLIGVLMNPSIPRENELNNVQDIVRRWGSRVLIVRVSAAGEFGSAFATLVTERVGALIIIADTYLVSQSDKLGALTLRHAIPAMGNYREFVSAGGLMSYGSSVPDTIRQAGIYTGKILSGTKPADLPVMQPTRFQFIFNLKTAKALGLTVPDTLLARADEVIE
jgi:putative ABC transport system substrate-binding protein